MSIKYGGDRKSLELKKKKTVEGSGVLTNSVKQSAYNVKKLRKNVKVTCHMHCNKISKN